MHECVCVCFLLDWWEETGSVCLPCFPSAKVHPLHLCIFMLSECVSICVWVCSSGIVTPWGCCLMYLLFDLQQTQSWSNNCFSWLSLYTIYCGIYESFKCIYARKHIKNVAALWILKQKAQIQTFTPLRNLVMWHRVTHNLQLIHPTLIISVILVQVWFREIHNIVFLPKTHLCNHKWHI